MFAYFLYMGTGPQHLRTSSITQSSIALYRFMISSLFCALHQFLQIPDSVLYQTQMRNIFFFQVLTWDLQNKLLHFRVGWWWRSWSFCKDGSQWNWIWWYAGDFFAISLVEHISFRQPYNSFMLKALCFLFHVLGNLNIFLNEYVNCSSPG